jgi:hypothetical protein
MNRDRQWTIAIALIAFVAYANAIANGFALDDRWIVLTNPLVESISGMWRTFGMPYWPNGLVGQYRPLVIASFSLEWAVAHGAPWLFHLVNVCWHVAATLLVLKLARQLLAEAGAVAAAVLFAVHPVHVEAVSSIVGRCELMAGVFVLAALLAHRAGRWTAVLWYVMALFSKESGIVFLGLAVCHDVLLTDGRWVERLRARRALYAGYGAAIVAYVGVLTWVFRGGKVVVVPSVTWMGATTVDRWLTMLRVVPEYLRLMVFPWDLAVDYTPGTINLVTSVTPLVVLGGVLLVAAIVVVARSWRRAPVVAFGLLWFGIALSPVANVFFASGIVLAERTLYLPSVGVVLVMGWVVVMAMRHVPRAAVAGLVAGVAALFAVRGWYRTPAWHDNKSLALVWVGTHPESYRGHAWASIVLSKANDWPASGREAARARSLFPMDPGPYMLGSEAALAMRDTATAFRLLDSAVAVAPTEGAPLVRRARLHAIYGQWHECMADARRAYAIDPRLAGAIAVQVSAAQHLGDVPAARAAFEQGLRDHPRSRNLHLGYAEMLRFTGDTAMARREDALAAHSPPESSELDVLFTNGL